MAETAKYKVENKMGCGFVGSFLQLRSRKPRNRILDSVKPPLENPTQKPIPIPVNRKLPYQYQGSRVSDDATRSNKTASQLVNSSYIKRITKEPTFTSSEFSLNIARDQPKFDVSRDLYRASTGNVMLLGHLGNLKLQHGKEKSLRGNKRDVINGNIVKRSMESSHLSGNVVSSKPNIMDSDVLKSLGNHKYKQGNYEEALAFYNQAIAIDPSKAFYYSNKSAALIGLGRLIEAVFECREAIRIDPFYHNAHFRLGKLYLRLGIADKAVYHYKLSGRKASLEDIAQAQALMNCIHRCNEAQNLGDWSKLIDESQAALSMGADSASYIHAMKTEALLKLHRHEEADAIIEKEPHLSIDLHARLFGSSATATLLSVRALVFLANGRFEDAVAAIQHASKLDSSNALTVERFKSVTIARLNGNHLFKACRYSEALCAYTKGLEKDPHNSILLCNRAACLSKLGQYQKAIKDCTEALKMRPRYSKARLRRANCNAELAKWEAAIEDYELLMQEIPGDEQVKTELLRLKMKQKHQSKVAAPIGTTFPELSFSQLSQG